MKKNVLSSTAVQLAITAVVIFTVMAFAKPRSFLSPINFKSMGIQIADVGLFTLGIALTMVSGGIDLSIVSLANLTSVINAVLIKSRLTPDSSSSGIIGILAVCFVITLALGVAGGLLNGFLVAALRIPPILATLGTMNIFAGISVVITTGQGIIGFPDQLLFFGAGEIVHIPVPVIVMIIVTAAMFVVLHKTPYGLKVQYYGSNRTASFFSGINNKRVVYLTYMIAGLLGALSGLLIMARTNSATVDYGSSIIIYALLAAVLGGVSPLGGRGNVFHIALALVVMQFLNSGLNILRISNFLRETTPGILLIVVMTFNNLVRRARERALNKKVLSASTAG